MKKSLVALILAVLLALAAFLPLPLLVVAPGGAIDVPPRVDFAAPEDEIEGRLLLTTVRLVQPRPVGAFLAWLDDDEELIRRERVIPEGQDAEQYFEAQRELFAESARLAAAVGLRAAGLPVDISAEGVRVVAVLDGAPAEGVLEAGDVIVAVDGQPVELAADLVQRLGQYEAGDEVQLTIGAAAGDQRTVTVELRRVRGLDRPALGVGVETVGLQIDLPFAVEVDQGRIGGPSAGLMLALTVYDLATPDDLVRGRVIAGTGTIDLTGDVGPVGGVRQKVAAAVDAGAEIFLAPAVEAAEARAAADGELEVISVDTLQDAIEALTQL